MQICIIDLNLIFLLSFCFVFLTHNILPFLLHFFMTSSVTFYCEQIFFVIKNMMKTPYLIIWHDGEKYFLKMHCHLLICTYVFTRFFLNFHYTYWGISFWFVNCKFKVLYCKNPDPIRKYFTLYEYMEYSSTGFGVFKCGVQN